MVALALCASGAGLTLLTFAAPAQNRAAKSSSARAALTNLERSSGTRPVVQQGHATGVYDFVRAEGHALLSADNTKASPEERARTFLNAHGSLVGMSEAERNLIVAPTISSATTPASALQVASVFTDEIGAIHVKFNQTYQGLKVFGAQLIVHMNDRGITAVNGNFIPGINLETRPSLTAEAAAQQALEIVSKTKSGAGAQLSVTETELAVYRTGLLEGYQGKSVLAYGVKVSSGEGPLEQVWLSAQTGAELIRIPLRQEHHNPLHRTVYSPRYDSSNPSLHVVRDEDDLLPSPVPQIEGLFQFSGQTYNLFSSAFGRSSFDGMSAQMRTVYLVNSICPNAYWDGATTNYCPEVDGDDVVAHEWGHAYTQFTHNLVYSFQSGALNESYSDIWGETVDLHNNIDGEGGSINNQPGPTGQRWKIGEDVAGLGPLRDMWTPTNNGDPEKVSSTSYFCGPSDGGGVHTNSGVPNHAYAIMVDGKTFNGQTVTGLGFLKTMHLYFRAMSVYQHSTTNFPHHAQSLLTACNDLRVAGTNLNNFSLTSANGTASGQVITASDCAEVQKVIAAVEMQRPPTQCNFGPLLNPNTLPDCEGKSDVFTEDWETGEDGWTKASVGSFQGWPNFNFMLDDTLPAGRPGTATFAWGFGGGVCGDPNGDYSGSFSITSPTITAGPNDTDLQMSFEHFVATEFLVDGGNVLISVNGGAFQLIPQENYTFNAPPSELRAPPPVDQNTNPKAGQFAWSGADPEVPAFGTTKARLSSLVQPGDAFKLRWEFGLDGCGGNQGWYVDNIRVFNCPVLPAPTIAIGSGYENPDTNGSYEITWTRPAGASGPDTLQESTTSCAPLVFDNAEAGLTQWNVSMQGAFTGQNWSNAPAGEKPQHSSQTFRARALEGTTNASAIMTYKNPIAIPALGTTTLSFQDWYIGELDDGARVEVSEDGTTWSAVYQTQRAELTPVAGEFFGTEPLFQQHVDLTALAGKSIQLRFRNFVGPTNGATRSPFGWYVDNISLTNEHWADVATNIGGTSFQVSHQPAGTHCYRVRTTYIVGGQPVVSPFSNVVSANVAAGPAALEAVSRKMHEVFEGNIPLPLIGTPGVECRTGSTAGSHQIVVTFAGNVAVSDAGLSSGEGSVNNFTPSGSQITLDLADVENAQTIVVTMTGVTDGNSTGSVSVPMSALLGDANGDRRVNVGDTNYTKANAGSTNVTNFRADVDSDGRINVTDTIVVKGQGGTALGTAPPAQARAPR